MCGTVDYQRSSDSTDCSSVRLWHRCASRAIARRLVSWFQNLFDAPRKIVAWRIEYNEERPHQLCRSLQPVPQTPSEFCIPSCGEGSEQVCRILT